MTLPLILLAGVGMWFLMEGAAYAVAPDFMRRLAELVAEMGTRELTMAGLAGSAIGVALIWLAVHFG